MQIIFPLDLLTYIDVCNLLLCKKKQDKIYIKYNVIIILCACSLIFVFPVQKVSILNICKGTDLKQYTIKC